MYHTCVISLLFVYGTLYTMSDSHDIRFIEPTSFEIRPVDRRGLLIRVVMQAFPSVVKNERQANGVLVIISCVCLVITFFLYWNILFGGRSQSPRNIPRNEFSMIDPYESMS